MAGHARGWFLSTKRRPGLVPVDLRRGSGSSRALTPPQKLEGVQNSG
jgi:hypothetical protein